MKPDNYIFDARGNLNIEKTSDNFDQIIIPEHFLVKAYKINPQDGVQRKNGNLVLKAEKGIITNANSKFNIIAKDKSGNPFNKIGVKLTVTDNNIADKIFKTIAANSEVEYKNVEYIDQKKTRNDIWTSKERSSVSIQPLYELADKYEITKNSHSHNLIDPTAEYANHIGPSSPDLKAASDLKSKKRKHAKNTISQVYSPAEYDDYIKYDKNGMITPLDSLKNKTRDEYNKDIADKFEKYYFSLFPIK